MENDLCALDVGLARHAMQNYGPEVSLLLRKIEDVDRRLWSHEEAQHIGNAAHGEESLHEERRRGPWPSERGHHILVQAIPHFVFARAHIFPVRHDGRQALEFSESG